MHKDVRVLVVEEDLYSRDMMTMLLMRDWRTRVIGEIDDCKEVNNLLAQPLQRVDLVIIGIETPGDQVSPFQVLEEVRSLPNPPVVLYAGTKVKESIIEHTYKNEFGGYLLKDEIVYALASAVVLASHGYCVITPGVNKVIRSREIAKQTLILDGTKKVADFSKRESEIIRLGILFNLSQRDIADELLIGTDWISETMSNVYDKLGLHEILTGEVSLRNYFTDETILKHYKKILDRAQQNISSGRVRKAPWMSTLAFHLLTVPEVEEL